MSNSIASQVHRAIYGKSDAVDAPENQNEEFQAGWKAGLESTQEAPEVIEAEWIRRGSPLVECPNFHEWKRGYWAQQMQAVERKMLEKKLDQL